MYKLKLRNTTIEDIELIFNWSNDFEVRQNSFNTNQILWDEHVNWFNKTISNKNILFYILTDDMNNNIGQIRISVEENNNCIISFSIDKTYRQKGFGKIILHLAEQKLKEVFKNFKLVAFVKLNNIASQKAFIANGYTEANLNPNSIEYNKIIN